MKVGLLTSWSTPCGIADYSRHLANAFAGAGTDVTVLGSRNYGAREVDEPTDLPLVRCFDVEMWSHGQRELDVEEILALDLDVLHVQYQCILYHRGRLQQVLNGFQGVKAITYHDNAIPPDMPGPWDLEFRHRADTGPKGQVIPFGIEDEPLLVRAFGLGRTREDVVRPICDRHGWRFENAAGGPWMSQLDLHRWLREADVIVLWYPDAPMAGSSQAARTALATRRPVFVNQTTWFSDLPDDVKGLHKLPDSPDALEEAMVDVLDNPYIAGCSWDRVAEFHLRSYREAVVSLAA